MRFQIGIVLFSLLSACCNQPEKKNSKEDRLIEGGRCIYKKYKELAYVSGFTVDDNDSLVEVNFTIVDEQPTGLLRLANSQIKKIGKGLLNERTVKDTSIIYRIEGARITHGSCYPFFIDQLSLKKEN